MVIPSYEWHLAVECTTGPERPVHCTNNRLRNFDVFKHFLRYCKRQRIRQKWQIVAAGNDINFSGGIQANVCRPWMKAGRTCSDIDGPIVRLKRIEKSVERPAYYSRCSMCSVHMVEHEPSGQTNARGLIRFGDRVLMVKPAVDPLPRFCRRVDQFSPYGYSRIHFGLTTAAGKWWHCSVSVPGYVCARDYTPHGKQQDLHIQ
jgi:hypothetical protein